MRKWLIAATAAATLALVACSGTMPSSSSTSTGSASGIEVFGVIDTNISRTR